VLHPNVSALLDLMDPPTEGGDDCDWDDIERQTSWRFPADYRDFTTVFGAGEIRGGVGISTPPLRGIAPLSGILRDNPYPPADGLLMWGGADVAEDYYWRCADPDPELWTVAVRARRGTWHEYATGMTGFLLKLLAGEVVIGLNMAGERHTFRGWREDERRVREQYPDDYPKLPFWQDDVW
jgi:hypothetical protein